MPSPRMRLPALLLLFGMPFCLLLGKNAEGAVVAFNPNATATFSQTDFSVDEAVNGVIGPAGAFDGWALDPNEVGQTAVFETALPAGFGFPTGTNLTFTLQQIFGGNHTIGRFRLSVTTDSQASYGNGADSGGTVAASWTILDPLSAVSTNGATLTEQGDFSILASGTNPDTAVYTITAFTNLLGITGIRLEVLEDASLPLSGPGRQPTNGNFVLSEFQLDITPGQVTAAVPEPTAICIWAGLGLVATGGAFRRRRITLQ